MKFIFTGIMLLITSVIAVRGMMEITRVNYLQKLERDHIEYSKVPGQAQVNWTPAAYRRNIMKMDWRLCPGTMILPSVNNKELTCKKKDRSV